jgi:hypothetical protein
MPPAPLAAPKENIFSVSHSLSLTSIFCNVDFSSGISWTLSLKMTPVHCGVSRFEPEDASCSLSQGIVGASYLWIIFKGKRKRKPKVFLLLIEPLTTTQDFCCCLDWQPSVNSELTLVLPGQDMYVLCVESAF